MNKPFISVILPVYNAEAYLLESLRSISSQTFRDLELIAIDDGSTDKSLSILKNYSQTENRMRLISRENRGLVKTLNEGIMLASGEWVARMDADDICQPDRLEKQLAWANAKNAEICGGGIERTGITGKHYWVFPSSCEGIYTWLLFRSAFAHPTVIMRKATALQFPYNEEFSCAQDYELWTRMALHKVRMTNYPETVLKYRIHNDQISHSKKQLQTAMRMEIARRYWEKSELTHDLHFTPALVDESRTIGKIEFNEVMRNMGTLLHRLADIQAINAVVHHQVWFVYRSVDLGFSTVMPKLRNLQLSSAKKFAIAFLATFRAGKIIDYLQTADWIRCLPLHWFF